ncbi:hypothetical protein ANANG_G00073900, partial [Anguilla anguilla]
PSSIGFVSIIFSGHFLEVSVLIPRTQEITAPGSDANPCPSVTGLQTPDLSRMENPALHAVEMAGGFLAVMEPAPRPWRDELCEFGVLHGPKLWKHSCRVTVGSRRRLTNRRPSESLLCSWSWKQDVK